MLHLRNHQSALDNHQSIPRDPCVSAFVQKVTKTRGLSLGAWPFGMAFTRWFYAPTGRKGIAQGKAKRRPGIRYATKVASPERAERTHGETNARCAHRGRAPTRNAGTVPGYSTSKITNHHSTIINPTPRSLRVSGCLKSGQNRIDAWRCSSKHLARKCLTSSRSAC